MQCFGAPFKYPTHTPRSIRITGRYRPQPTSGNAKLRAPHYTMRLDFFPSEGKRPSQYDLFIVYCSLIYIISLAKNWNSLKGVGEAGMVI